MESNTSSTHSDDIRRGVRPSGPISKLVDWVTAALLVFGGLLFATAGAGLYSLADQSRIASWVAEGQLTSTELTDAELIDTTQALLTWGGLGMAVTGVLLLLGGAGYLLYRSRMRARTDSNDPDSITLATIGAVVTIVTSFVPLSPILGGLVSGYLRDGDGADGARIGAYAGLAAAVPFALLGLFLLGGIGIATAELGLGGLGVFVGLALVFSFGVGAAYLVGLSALGGYIGVSLAARNRDPSA